MQARAGRIELRLRIRGELSGTLLTAFPELHAGVGQGETVLTGALPDQAALFGVFSEVEALGLELLEVRCDCLGV